MKRIYLFNTVAWNNRKKIGFPVCKKENFAGIQAHRKRGKSARASPTPHHTLNEERSARFTAQHLSALLDTLCLSLIRWAGLSLCLCLSGTEFWPWCRFINKRRATRSSQMQNIPHFKTASGQKTFYHRLVSIWNSWKAILKLKLLSQYLPLSSIKTLESVSAFKFNLNRKVVMQGLHRFLSTLSCQLTFSVNMFLRVFT